MLKSILVLIMIIVIGLSSSSLPIEINRILYIPIEKSISYSLQPAHTEVTNPGIINFSINTTHTNVTIKDDPGNNIKIEAFKDGRIIDDLKHVELDNGNQSQDIIIARDRPLFVRLDISQKITGLTDGEYLFRFYCEHETLTDIEPLELKVNYKSNPQYYKSLNYQPKDSMGLKLYFPGPDGKHLVPVTRFVPYNAAVLTKTMEALAEGADPATTLQIDAIIPGFTKVYYSGTTVCIVLDPDLEKPTDNTDLIMALDSIVYTMTEIPQMKRVQFLPDGKRAGELVPGIDIGSPWAPETKPAAYLAYNTFDRYLLFPYRPDISEAKTIREQCYVLFNTLREGLPEDLIVEAVVPRDVELLNVYFLNGVLKLDFNDAFIEAYNDERHKQYMMMDSILYTFSSIEGVKSIQVLINGSDRYSFADYNLSKPLTRPLYLNPETN